MEAGKGRMIRYLHISNGRVKKGSSLEYKLPKNKDLLWIFMMAPSEQETIKVAKDFRLDRKLIEKYPKEHHSVRYSMSPFQFVIVDYYLDNGKVATAHLLFIIKDNLLVLVSTKDSQFYEELFEKISARIEMKNVPANNIGRVLHAFLQEDIEANYDVLDKREEEITALEERVADFEGTKTTSIKEIILLKRKLFMMGRRFWASTKIIFLMKAGFTSVKIDAETNKLLVDVHDTFLHQIDIVTSQKEMLSDVMNIYSTSINNRLAFVSNELNQIIKRLSSWGLILLLPTLIATIYGMNFDFMPLLSDTYGFHAIMAFILVTILVPAFFFKRKGWL